MNLRSNFFELVRRATDFRREVSDLVEPRRHRPCYVSCDRSGFVGPTEMVSQRLEFDGCSPLLGGPYDDRAAGSRAHDRISDQTEHELIRAAASGNADAAAILWDRHSPLVRRLLRRMIGADDADIEDLLHESFLKAFRALDRLREHGNLRAYIYSIATNVARDELRRRKRWRFFLRGVRTDPDASVDQSKDHDATEALQNLQRILDGLTPDLRVAFVLRHVESRELTDVAKLMKWSLSTTKRRLQKASQIIASRAQRDPVLHKYLGGDARA